MRSLQEIDADISKVQALINHKEAQRQAMLSDPYAVENSPAQRAAVFDYIVEGDRSGIDALMQQKLSAALQKKSAEEAKSENQNRAMKQWQDAVAVVQDLDTRSTRGEVVSAKDKALAKNALSYAETEMKRVGLGDYLKVPEAPVAEKKAEVVVAEEPKTKKTEAELYEDIKAYMQNPQEVIPNDITAALDTLEKSEGGIYRDYAKSTREQANKASAESKEKREAKEKQEAEKAKQEAADKESNELKTLSSKADDPNVTIEALKSLRKEAEKYGDSQARQDLLNKIDNKIKLKTPETENPLFTKGIGLLSKFDSDLEGKSGTVTREFDGHVLKWDYEASGSTYVVTPSSIDGKKAKGKPRVLKK